MRLIFLKGCAATVHYTLSLHDALPILPVVGPAGPEGLLWATGHHRGGVLLAPLTADTVVDRKSTRLNSSHRCNSYAVFCLEKKKERTACARCDRKNE